MKKPSILIIMLTVFTIGLVAFSPQIWAMVEPHITITMDPGQTTKPFVINDDTGNEVFSVDVDGATSGPTVKTVTNGVLNVSENLYDDVSGVFYGSFGEQGIGILVGDTEPASFTYSHVIGSSELPTGISEFTTNSLRSYLSAQFLNTDTVSVTLFVKTFVNGIEVLSDSRFISSGQYGLLFSSPDVSVTAGDTIQIKAWADTANQIELRKVIIYTLPHKVTVDPNRVSIIFDDIFFFGPILPSSITETTRKTGVSLNYKVNVIDGTDNGLEWGFENMNIFKDQTLTLTRDTGDLLTDSSDRIFIPRVPFFSFYQTLP